ncbi:GntR family transcriptional regulator [Niallia sp. Sow4_A1]|uniref:GntR family transcriptional regulator n=1 Tax=Bacillaceae TaxID=186817 RepID=UPI001F4851DA|nr:MULTISPECIES: GntR family transcriptional regulator [Bacillaceae]MCF2649194.1 GntR family transcriptional regulator [Niallia circulans]CAI9395144.1 HTH-type transcriptional regulator McbR [Bacillus sp. T2.9-1]
MDKSKEREEMSLSLKDKVKKILRDEIIINKLKPGDRVVETEVAKRLGISQVPVREALRGLEEEGLIRTVKYKGAFVTEINKTEMYHIFSLRASIETNAIEIITPYLTNKKLGELYDIVEQMKNEKPDYLLQSKLDMEFHRTIISWSGIETYNRIWSMLNSHIQRYITVLNPEIKIMPEEVHTYHLKLVEVLKEKDIQKSKEVFWEHIMKMVL